MITVYFPKYIRELTDGVESHKFDTTDIVIVADGLRVLFPKLSLLLTNINSHQINNLCYFMDKETKKILTFSLSTEVKSTELVLLITIYGQGEDFTQIAIGAALIAASFIPGMQFLMPMGINMLISGFIGLLSPKQSASPNSAPDEAVRAQNDAFAGLQNTTSTDQAVPLIFGLTRVPGQFIGGRIRTINHDAYTVVSVANYV